MTINTIDSERTINAIVAGVNGDPLAGTAFKQALQNRDERPAHWSHSLSLPRGIVMCYGDDEGLAAIRRAWHELKSPTEARHFAALVTAELRKFAESFPANDHNLCYAHFLLHGLGGGASAEDIAAKIADNIRIIHETERCAADFIKSAPPRSPIEGYQFSFSRGQTDDYQGISLAFSPVTSPAWHGALAKTGFFIDSTNRRAVIVNVQGRKVFGHRPVRADEKYSRDEALYDRDLAAYLKSAKEGRQFARVAAQVEMDPRAYVITSVFDSLRRHKIEDVCAIRPSEHVMAIGRHSGFRGNYEPVLAQAGLRELNLVYYQRRLIDGDNPCTSVTRHNPADWTPT